MANNKKQALGRGIDALFTDNRVSQEAISNANQSVTDNQDVTVVQIDALQANPYQPRQTFDQTALKELSESIRQNGIVQPLVVRKTDNQKYQIVAGERRFRAAALAGLKEIPIVIRQFDDDAMMEIAIVENLQRENLNPIEEAAGIKSFMEKMQLTQEQVADRLHKSRSAITNLLRLLNLPQPVQKLVIDQKISMGHARALLGINDENRINQVADLIVKDNLSVRQVEQIAKEGNIHQKTPFEKSTPKSLDKNILAIVDALEEKFGSKVTLDSSKLTIALHGNADLNRILDILDIQI